MSYFSLYLDYRYPKGGTGALPAALSAYCTEKGVQISTGTAIVQLHPEQHLAVTQTGERIAYRTLVWAADQKALYRAVQPDAIRNGALRDRVRKRQAMLEPLKGNDSLFSLYIAADRDPNAFSVISNGHLFYTPSAKGLGGLFHEDLDALLEEEKEVRAGSLPPVTYRDHICQWLDRYLAGTTYEISIPVLRDPALAPEGKTGLIVSTLMDHTLFRIIRDMGWHDEMKARCETRILQSLSESIYPGLDQVVLETFSHSPLSLERQTGNTGGAITGWAFTNPVIPAVAKMQKVATSVNTPLPDVYQAGQWAYSPAGLPISVLTGKLAAEKAIKRLKTWRP
jgi:all-trans-retinol 13,14-reductase